MRLEPEISWILEGKSPDQIPMARLAEYLRQLAIMLGEIEDVHFDRVEKACTRVVARMRPGKPAQRVQARVYAVRDKSAPTDAMRAFHAVDRMVGEDRGHARVKFGAGTILRFPGKTEIVDKLPSLIDLATVTGRLYSLMEDDSGTIKVRIRPRNGSAYVACTADSHVAVELRKFFLDVVRVDGKGLWQRSEGGDWVCESLHISDVHAVKDVTFREAIDALRTVQPKWPKNLLAQIDALQETKGAS